MHTYLYSDEALLNFFDRAWQTWFPVAHTIRHTLSSRCASERNICMLAGWLVLPELGLASLPTFFNELVEVCPGYPVVLFANLDNL